MPPPRRTMQSIKENAPRWANSFVVYDSGYISYRAYSADATIPRTLVWFEQPKPEPKPKLNQPVGVQLSLIDAGSISIRTNKRQAKVLQDVLEYVGGTSATDLPRTATDAILEPLRSMLEGTPSETEISFRNLSGDVRDDSRNSRGWGVWMNLEAKQQ